MQDNTITLEKMKFLFHGRTKEQLEYSLTLREPSIKGLYQGYSIHKVFGVVLYSMIPDNANHICPFPSPLNGEQAANFIWPWLQAQWDRPGGYEHEYAPELSIKKNPQSSGSYATTYTVFSLSWHCNSEDLSYAQVAVIPNYQYIGK